MWILSHEMQTCQRSDDKVWKFIELIRTYVCYYVLQLKRILRELEERSDQNLMCSDEYAS